MLQKGTEKQLIYVLRKIKEMPDDRLFDDVSRLIDHPSAHVRAEVLGCLYFFNIRENVEKILPLINDSDQQVKIAAFDYLITHSREKRDELMWKYLQEKDSRVRGAALVSLAMETRNNPELKMKFDLDGRINKKINSLSGLKDPDELKFRKLIILKAIGQGNQKNYYDTIKGFMKDKDPEIVSQAILSAGNTMSLDFIIEISVFLSQDQYKDIAKTALQNYGPAIIDTFNEIIRNETWGIDLIYNIPSIIEKIGTQQSAELLFQLLDHHDIGLKMEALRSLNNLKVVHPQLRFHNKDVIRRILEEAHLYMETLAALYAQITAIDMEEAGTDQEKLQKQSEARKGLVNLLERRLDGNLERIFRLLGLKYAPDDMLTIYQGLISRKPDMRINAVEFLDNLLTTNLKKILVPIVETAMVESISEKAIKNLNLKIPDEFECLSMLLAGKDMKINMAVLYLISKLDNKKYIPLVAQFTQHENPRISTFAKTTLTDLLKDY